MIKTSGTGILLPDSGERADLTIEFILADELWQFSLHGEYGRF